MVRNNVRRMGSDDDGRSLSSSVKLALILIEDTHENNARFKDGYN